MARERLVAVSYAGEYAKPIAEHVMAMTLVRRYLRGEPVTGLIRREDYLPQG